MAAIVTDVGQIAHAHIHELHMPRRALKITAPQLRQLRPAAYSDERDR
jgi:hypothetical protein